MAALCAGLIAVTIFAFTERSEIEKLGQRAASHQDEISSLQSRVAAADGTLSRKFNGNLQDQLANQDEKTSAIDRQRSRMRPFGTLR